MISAKSAVEAAAYAFLAENILGAAVYQDVPEDAPYPLVIVGDLSTKRLPGKAASKDRLVTVSIATLVAAEERQPLLGLMDQIDGLDGYSAEYEGWTLAFSFEDDDASLLPDGQAYGGVSTFSVLALSPD